jgi:hypothetical protein
MLVQHQALQRENSQPAKDIERILASCLAPLNKVALRLHAFDVLLHFLGLRPANVDSLEKLFASAIIFAPFRRDEAWRRDLERMGTLHTNRYYYNNTIYFFSPLIATCTCLPACLVISSIVLLCTSRSTLTAVPNRTADDRADISHKARRGNNDGPLLQLHARGKGPQVLVQGARTPMLLFSIFFFCYRNVMRMSIILMSAAVVARPVYADLLPSCLLFDPVRYRRWYYYPSRRTPIDFTESS